MPSRRRSPLLTSLAVVSIVAALQAGRTIVTRQEILRACSGRQPLSGDDPLVVVLVDPECTTCRQCVAAMVERHPQEATVHVILVGEKESIRRASSLLEAVQAVTGFSPPVILLLGAATSIEAVTYCEENPEVLGISSTAIAGVAEIAHKRVQANAELLRRLRIRDVPAVHVDGWPRYDGCSAAVLATIR